MIYGTVLFCDDVRTELTGKGIYIGVYDANIIIPEPLAMPLFIITDLYYTDDNDPRHKVDIVVHQPDGKEVSRFSLQFPEGTLQELRKADQSIKFGRVRTMAQFLFHLTLGRIIVNLETQGNVQCIGSLAVQVQKAEG